MTPGLWGNPKLGDGLPRAVQVDANAVNQALDEENPTIICRSYIPSMGTLRSPAISSPVPPALFRHLAIAFLLGGLRLSTILVVSTLCVLVFVLIAESHGVDTNHEKSSVFRDNRSHLWLHRISLLPP